MKKRFLVLPLLFGLLTGCGNNPENNPNNPDPVNPTPIDPENVHIASVSLNKKSLTLIEGTFETLTYTISPSNAKNKNVTWESSNSIVASVENGVVHAWNEGTATISIFTEDGNKTDSCNVTVNKVEPEKSLIKDDFDLNEQGYTFSNKSLVNEPIEFNDYTIEFAVGENTYNNQPSIVKATNKHYEARIYWGNTMKVTSTTNTLSKIEFVLGENDKGNTITCSTGEMKNGSWEGEAKEIVFAIAGTSGYKAFESFTLCYEGETDDDPEKVVNLGKMTIAEVKNYIKENPVKKNSFGNGVNENRYVTIEGLALAKIDLIKYTSKFGLDVSEHGKVIMGDETGVIGVASVVNNLGTSLWGKIGENVNKTTSTYVVTGYISEYLGHPEILVTSFMWDQTLDIKLDFEKLSLGIVSLQDFYQKAENTIYNCAGHAYGEVITVKNVKCFYVEPDGQGKRYYNFTDGSKNIRVNAFNLSNAVVGNVYDITGIISIKNLSPIIVAFSIKSSTSTVDFNYETAATSITISELKAIHGTQDDTNEKYPAVINAYGNFYKTTGYMVAVEENEKLYVGISDTPRETLISGKTNAMANYNVVLIKNENFWNTTEDELYLFNPIYDEYLCEEKPIDVYFVTRQLEYSKNKPMWEILLIPESIPESTIL